MAPEDREAEVLKSVRCTGLVIDLTAPVHYRSSAATEPAEGIPAVAWPADYDLVVVLARPRCFWGELFHRSPSTGMVLGLLTKIYLITYKLLTEH